MAGATSTRPPRRCSKGRLPGASGRGRDCNEGLCLSEQGVTDCVLNKRGCGSLRGTGRRDMGRSSAVTLLLATSALAIGALAPIPFGATPAAAQSTASSSIGGAAAQNLPWVGITPRAQLPVAASSKLGKEKDPNAQMFVQADELNYDYASESVVAVGRVQIHYSGSVLEANRVIYDKRNKRLHAEGGVRLTEADGKIVTAERMDLSDDFRDGFVDSLRLETGDKTYLAAARSERTQKGEDKYTVFQSGVYTACEPCKDNPNVPPKWQVKAARILHDESEHLIYFEDAKFELFGFPIAYFPYLWAPDPTVKKQTGFLQPSILYGSRFGIGFDMPFFWNLAPDYDVTIAPVVTSRQGVIPRAEFRQRLMNGAYSIRASGVFQLDRKEFVGTPGDRDFRGAIESKGDFRLSEKWFAGWDVSAFSDPSYAPDYKLTRQASEAISNVYLFGRGTNSYLDARLIYFYGLSPIDIQKQLPVVAPLIDYKSKLGYSVFGGELSYNVNATNIHRDQADYDPIRIDPVTGLGVAVCDNVSPTAIKTRANCLLRGIAGDYTRLSADVQWRREIVDKFGQIFTPFIYMRADIAAASIVPDPSVGNFIQPGDSTTARFMPAVGVDYKYPFISAHSWGTQIIQPHAQVIIRPDETAIGRLPNEDSQALTFDDTNLFSINKFAGWDRVEGGGRANVGLEYTAQFNKGGSFNALFGQSYQLFGTNSYAVADVANTGTNSGLQTDQSDYVARATFQPNRYYSFTSRFRFDQSTFETKRLEVEAKANFDRFSASVTYGQYAAQQNIGFLYPREAIMPQGNLKLTQNWSLNGYALYSLDSDKLNAVGAGVGYIDECIALNMTFLNTYGYRGDIVPSQSVMLQLVFRTFGGTTVTQAVGGLSNPSSGYKF